MCSFGMGAEGVKSGVQENRNTQFLHPDIQFLRPQDLRAAAAIPQSSLITLDQNVSRRFHE